MTFLLWEQTKNCGEVKTAQSVSASLCVLLTRPVSSVAPRVGKDIEKEICGEMDQKRRKPWTRKSVAIGVCVSNCLCITKDWEFSKQVCSKPEPESQPEESWERSEITGKSKKSDRWACSCSSLEQTCLLKIPIVNLVPCETCVTSYSV